jgi:hypothetical protein
VIKTSLTLSLLLIPIKAQKIKDVPVKFMNRDEFKGGHDFIKEKW